MKTFGIIFLVIAFNTGSQIFFKLAALAASDGFWRFGLMLGCAFILPGLSFISWAYALRLKPISFLHPFLALGFLTVPLASQIVFNESLSLKYYLGIAMIIAGVCVASKSVLQNKSGKVEVK